jgi:HlyD family secretion protein
VMRIKPVGEDRHGDMIYTVVIAPQCTDGRLRWNMTAMVAIEPSRS